MIVEEREYQIIVGKVKEFWSLYREVGLPIQLRHIGPPLGFFSIDIGDISNFVHMWLYRSHSDREDRRHRLHEDPDWQAYLPQSQKYILAMRTRILNAFDVPQQFGAVLNDALIHKPLI
jgi:hypothetical protein